MNVLDENIASEQRVLLRAWHISVRQIGTDVGRMGMSDDEIISFLHRARRPTLFTLDRDFNRRSLCHPRYGIVFLDVDETQAALYIRRLLHHPAFDTEAKRMGTVVRLSPTGIVFCRLHAEVEPHLEWTA